jgi:hypothetical protein
MDIFIVIVMVIFVRLMAITNQTLSSKFNAKEPGGKSVTFLYCFNLIKNFKKKEDSTDLNWIELNQLRIDN